MLPLLYFTLNESVTNVQSHMIDRGLVGQGKDIHALNPVRTCIAEFLSN